MLASICGFAAADTVTYSRGDQNAYLQARGIGVRDPIQMKALRKNLKDPSIEDSPSFHYDDPQGCTMYLAESTITNSGMGMYTTVPYEQNELIAQSEIGIMMQDVGEHYGSDKTKDLFKSYTWGGATLANGKFEARQVEAMIPGFGMLANDHPGLTNVNHNNQIKSWEDNDYTLSAEGIKHETVGDVGRGASSAHSGLRFKAHRPLKPGDEMFISYGSNYFTAREETMGPIPVKETYDRAKSVLMQFMNRAKQDGLDITSLGMQKRYEERIYNADWLKEDARLKAALPENVSDIPTMLEMGVAEFSMKDKKRSASWVEENGMCIDNIVAGTTSIPQADHGAFATRTIKKDSHIITTVVVPYSLNQLKLRKEWKGYFIHGGFQQILNYCYGHLDSTLVFFPAAPTVNFINHGNREKANAEIRWSTSSYHHADWLDASVDETRGKMKSGLLFDFVATKDIKRGDEILVYYGAEWEGSWDRHIQKFADKSNFTEMIGVPTAEDLNQEYAHPILRTVTEQKTTPYPDHLMTVCYFQQPENCESPPDNSKGVKCEVQSKYNGVNLKSPFYRQCEILSRHSTDDSAHWYTANVTVKTMKQNEKDQKKSSHEVIDHYLVDYLPRNAIRFMNKPYTTDQYVEGAFRMPIGLDENMMAEQWMDLRRKSDAKDEL